MTLKTLRDNLETAITSNSNYSVYDVVPEIISTPSIMIMAGSPWLQPVTVGNNKAYRVQYVLECIAASISNPGALEKIESMVATVLPLIPTSWQIQNVSSPSIRSANTNDVYSVEISVTTIYNP